MCSKQQGINETAKYELRETSNEELNIPYIFELQVQRST